MKPLIAMLWLICLPCWAQDILTMHYHSEPSNAGIYERGNFFGRTPFVGRYRVTEVDRARGYILIPTVTARWESGITTNAGGKVFLSKGLTQKYVFFRPQAAGLETDLQAAGQASDSTEGWRILGEAIADTVNSRRQADAAAPSPSFDPNLGTSRKMEFKCEPDLLSKPGGEMRCRER